MGSNSFGNIFRITTWGESHGKALGVIIDGCPSGLNISEEEINTALSYRMPGRNSFTSPRKERDRVEILSGVFLGQTTGAPIALTIYNQDVDSSAYEETDHLLRPGHANSTYLKKYQVFDYRGGGRASARETVCRVAAGAIAEKILKLQNIEISAYIQQIGHIQAHISEQDISSLNLSIKNSLLFCPDTEADLHMREHLKAIQSEGDSIGGIVEFITSSLPAGLGDPIYEKLEATLAFAMMSIPASKGFEIGSGFNSVLMKGSAHNDLFEDFTGDRMLTSTNHAGGILGGISTGMPIKGRVAFKPTSSIKKPQSTLDQKGQKYSFQFPAHARHDPCVAIRAVPVVKAMLALVLVDKLLTNRCVLL